MKSSDKTRWLEASFFIWFVKYPKQSFIIPHGMWGKYTEQKQTDISQTWRTSSFSISLVNVLFPVIPPSISLLRFYSLQPSPSFCPWVSDTQGTASVHASMCTSRMCCHQEESHLLKTMKGWVGGGDLTSQLNNSSHSCTNVPQARANNLMCIH